MTCRIVMCCFAIALAAGCASPALVTPDFPADSPRINTAVLQQQQLWLR